MFAGLRLVCSSRVLAAGLDDVIILLRKFILFALSPFGLPGDRPSEISQIEFLRFGAWH
jgi:hypothetical protein